MLSTDAKLKKRYNVVEQQQKKLLYDSKGSPAGNSDELHLHTQLGAPKPNAFDYPEELKQKFEEQILELKDENGRLYKLVTERDHELRRLRKRLDDNTLTLTGSIGPSADGAATKIVELSKRVRELNAELASEQTRVNTLSKQLRDKEDEFNAVEAPLEATVEDEEVRDHRKMMDKLNRAETKLLEYKSHCSQLKQEIRIAHKVLTNELGDSIDIQQLLANGGAGWRGRQQQIISLQGKLEELRKQTGQRNRSLEEEMMHGEAAASVEDRNKAQIRQLVDVKRAQSERVQLEIVRLSEESSALKKQVDGIKARNQTLANDNKKYKQQIKTLTDKCEHDDELINKLMKQHDQLKTLLNNLSSLQTDQSLESKVMTQQRISKQQRDANVVQQLQKLIAEKVDKVKQLEKEVKEAKEKALLGIKEQGQRHIETISPRQLPSVARTASVHSTEEATNSAQLTPHPSTDRSSNNPSNLESSGDASQHRLPQKVDNETMARETRVRVIELETIIDASEVERQQLGHLVDLLEGRLTDAQKRLSDAETQLQAERVSNVTLEKNLSRLKVSAGSTTRRVKGKTGDNFPSKQEQLENLSAELKSLELENRRLKSSFDLLVASRREDQMVFTDMLNKSRDIFFHGLERYKELEKQ